MNCTKDNTKCYWEQSIQHDNIFVSQTHNCTAMIGCHHCQKGRKISKSVCNKYQSHKAIQRSPICLTDSDHDFILDKIEIRDTIEYERK